MLPSTKLETKRRPSQKWAEDQDRESADYSIIGGWTPEVRVRRVPDGDVMTFFVSGEAVPHYYAKLMK